MDTWLDLINKAGSLGTLLLVGGLVATGKLLLSRELEPWRTAVQERDERIRELETEAKQLALDTRTETARQAELSRGETAQLRQTVNELVTQLSAREGRG